MACEGSACDPGDDWPVDAVLHEPPSERSQHTSGRPRVEGLRLPALEKGLHDPPPLWQKFTLN
jgi:hypothetical protein